jgi:hypothetical protein
LSAAATYLYQDGTRYWYATQATVTKLADDRAEQFKREPDKVAHELEQHLRASLRETGGFSRVHILPHSGGDVPDDLDARLVVLAPDHAYSKDAPNGAEVSAKEILEFRGTAPRLFRNTLVFLAADKVRLQDLEEALRKYLAWASIVAEKEALNLDPFQLKQAENQKQAAAGAVLARLPETYQWLLVPEQPTAQDSVNWHAIRLSGSEPLAVRAAKKLKSDELLIGNLAASRLRMELDRVPLWRGDHVAIRQLVEDFARYLYLPRAQGPEILAQSMREGIELLTWQRDSFAYADSFDEAAGRYRGLRCGQMVSIASDEPSLQRQSESSLVHTSAPTTNTGMAEEGTVPADGGSVGTAPAVTPKRFHGSVTLDATRVGRDASRIGEEVISHLSALVGAAVKVTLEIEAHIPNGVPDSTVRTVTENSRTLKFDSHGFEKE